MWVGGTGGQGEGGSPSPHSPSSLLVLIKGVYHPKLRSRQTSLSHLTWQRLQQFFMVFVFPSPFTTSPPLPPHPWHSGVVDPGEVWGRQIASTF